MQENQKTSLKEKIETIIPQTPETGKKLMLIAGSIGFAVCFSGLLYGGRAFVLGFIVMLCAATGYRFIVEKN